MRSFTSDAAHPCGAGSPTPRPAGGLYRHVRMSVKTANILVLVGVATLIFALCFLVSHNGFTVSFDTDGGSHITNQKAMHGDFLTVDTPVKEGYVFTGWFLDPTCTLPFNPAHDAITESITLYAGWRKAAA